MTEDTDAATGETGSVEVSADTETDDGSEDSVTAETTADSTTEPSGTTGDTQPSDACGRFAPLKEYDLNDRCVPEGDEGSVPDPLGEDFATSDLVWRVDECPGMVAVPNQVVLVTADDANLGNEIDRVAGVLSAAGIRAVPGAELADDAVVLDLLSDDVIPVGAVLERLPLLQGDGTSVDLNYLEPVLPNNIFRPYDDPVLATEPQVGAFSGATFTSAVGKWVAVIDSTDDGTVYDRDPDGEIGHGFIDQDHGHGRFVTSIIDRNGATVTLSPLMPNTVSSNNSSLLTSGRWAPMAIQDADIINALDSILNSESLDTLRAVNLSLGGVGCPSGAGDLVWGIGERLPLARKMRELLVENDKLVDNPADVVKFVAAAGNNGEDVLHFPAAWRNDAVTVGLAGAIPSAVDPTTGDPIDPSIVQDLVEDIEELHTALTPAIFAVGSVEADGSSSVFTNCGEWVNAAAFGNKQVGVYPASSPGAYAAPNPGPDIEYGPTDFAVWSGTSFATANFTAALVSGHSMPDSITGARLTGAGGLACPPQTPTNAGTSTTTTLP